MTEAAEAVCPECGTPLPEPLGQHALTPTSGLVECPNCGASTSLTGAGDTLSPGRTGAEGTVPDTSGQGDYFAGEETVEGVLDELDEKEEQ